ncbi:MAG: caspase family protein [Terracidiphilus sp.]
MKPYVALFCALITVPAGPLCAAQTQRALLIGINTYQPPGTSAQHPAGCAYGRCELGAFQNLDGSVNDAESMADLLTSAKFGFPANQVVLLTNPAPPRPRPGVTILPASQTTRDGILAAMQKYLVDIPKKGDTVIFYDASHGSLRVNSKGNKLTVLVGGKYVHADSTLVPSDAYTGGYDVRDREMTRIFNAALDKGVHLTVIFDSCHSGGITRGIGPKYVERTLAFDPRDINEKPETQTPPSERKENPALIFSAAQQDQTAKEMPPASPSAEPHGAFTAALLQTLEVLPADAPSSLVYERVRAVLEGSSVPDQEPDLDASEARRQQPLFGGLAAISNKVRSTALGANSDGGVTLDIGQAAGLGVGTEFTSEQKGKDDNLIVLRINALNGIARSTAEVVSPASATVNAGDIFDLSKWVPDESSVLRIWMWPSNLSQQQVLAAASQVQASGAALVDDPAEQQWTHVLSWHGSQWMLQKAGDASPVSLGATLTADALKQHLPAGAKLWANLPPSHQMAAELTPAPDSAVQMADKMSTAHYVLAGVVTSKGPAYAWYHKSALAAGPPSPDTPAHSPGCSTSSPYPVRSNWVFAGAGADLDDAGDKLNKYALRLAKVRGWIELANNPTDASMFEYYSLALLPSANDTPVSDTPLADNQLTHQGDEFRLALTSTDRIRSPRWVYVLDIDCHGAGQLLYPGNYTSNQFPNKGDEDLQFPLPGARGVKIGEPYGVDTLILLSTEQPLPDPFALNFEGVASRGTRGATSPLEKLLSDTSGGTRGMNEPEPTNWGISLSTVHSAPKTNDAAK